MKIDVIRDTLTEQSTTGRLLIDGEFECFTLEDKVRPDGIKIYGETAIPEGEYKVVITKSNRFQRDLPLVLDVPNFQGIRIHPGNTAADTHGCLLVGLEKGEDQVRQSRKAFDALMSKIQSALAQGEEVTIHYTQGE